MPLILPGNVATATAAVGYDVDNSCRFNLAGTASMTKDNGTPSSETTGTISFWLKRSILGVGDEFVLDGRIDASNRFKFAFNSNDVMEFWGTHGGADEFTLISNRKFRDVSAWMHIVIRIDTTQSTDSDRIRVYVNGVDEKGVGGYSSETYPDEDGTDVVFLEDGAKLTVGAYWNGSAFALPYGGYLAEVVYCDGQSLAPTEFGEYNSDSLTIWQPKDPSGLTFGNNGFYLDFKASDNLGNDANGGTDLSETNITAEDQCTDTPTNNFATFNPLARNSGDTSSLSEGNVKYSLSNYQYNARSTIGVNSGKWYFETKISDTKARIGIVTSNATNNLDTDSTAFYYGSTGLGAIAIMYNNGLNTTIYKTINDTSNVDSSAAGTAWSADDILMCAFDLDNNRIYWGEGGTWYFSADPEDGTNAISISNSGGDPWHVFAGYGTSAARSGEWNFGNPSFTISSSNADANDYGNFEFAVPAGYYALCTKNLAEFG